MNACHILLYFTVLSMFIQHLTAAASAVSSPHCYAIAVATGTL